MLPCCHPSVSNFYPSLLIKIFFKITVFPDLSFTLTIPLIIRKVIVKKELGSV